MARRRVSEIEADLYAAEKHDAIERARRGLLGFTRYTFPEFNVSWHHRYICRTLNRFARGEIPRLIIQAPPRHTKSELMSRRLPAKMFGDNPNRRIIAASYNQDLATDFNRDVQKIMTSDEYKDVYPKTRINEKNVRTADTGHALRNSDMFEIIGHRGYYKCAGIGGSLTGRGGDVLLLDDFMKDWEDAQSKKKRETQWAWYQTVFRTRLQKGGIIAITVTRWSEDDIVGRLLEQADKNPKADQWTVISLPAIAEDEPTEDDPRKPGEPLWPTEFSADDLETTRVGMVERQWLSLYQQRPTPPKGNLIKRDQWKYYHEDPREMARRMQRIISASDLTFEDDEKNDFVAMMVWGRLGPDFYALHCIHDRMDFDKQLDCFGAMALGGAWRIRGHHIEKSANGAALINTAKKKVPGIVPVVPKGSKYSRAESIAHLAVAGNVYLPDPDRFPWVRELVEEWAVFPAGKHDDYVDATSMGLTVLYDKPLSKGVRLGGTTVSRSIMT